VTRHIGGSPLNVAVGLARLEHRVALATHLGRDTDAAAIGAHAADAGVALVPGSDHAEDTPVATATLDAEGRAEYTFDITWRVPELPDRSGHMHAGSIGARTRPGGVGVLAGMDGGRRAVTFFDDANFRPPLGADRESTLAEVALRVAESAVVRAIDDDLEWLAGRPLDEEDHVAWL